MLELAQSLILNEGVLSNLSAENQSVFVYEWLAFLNQVLAAAQKVRCLPSMSVCANGRNDRF